MNIEKAAMDAANTPSEPSLVSTFLSDLISAVVIGVVTAGVWALIVWLYNRQRNRNLEKAIQDSLTPRGMNFHRDGSIGVKIKNTTMQTVVIRSVVLLCGEHKNNTLWLYLHDDSKKDGNVENERGWVELPAKTSGTWVYNFKKDRGFDPNQALPFVPVQTLAVTFEYKTVFGDTRIAEAEPTGINKQQITQTFEDIFTGKRDFF